MHKAQPPKKVKSNENKLGLLQHKAFYSIPSSIVGVVIIIILSPHLRKQVKSRIEK